MSAAGPAHRMLSAEKRASLLAQARAAAPDPACLRVFGYGSLMWNPCFEPAESEPARLCGYQRRFCIFTTRARGSPEKPGLGLGLIPGPGDCLGLAYRLSPATLDGDLEALFEREMGSGVYRPTWLEAHTREGPVPVLAFVVDKTHPQFAGDLKVDEMAALIAQGRGSYGACRDYLASTVDQLQRLGVPASEFESLLAQVDARAAGAPTRS